MDLFHITEETWKQTSSSISSRSSPQGFVTDNEQESFDQHAQELLDTHDPLSLFLIREVHDCPTAHEKWKYVIPNILGLRLPEQSICGGRIFISWGEAPAESSPCAAQDGPPLHGKYKGRPITLYPRGVFNELTFGAAGVSLRRDLCKVPTGDCPSAFLNELSNELDRIAKHLQEQYPQLEVFLQGLDLPSVPGIRLPTELQREKTFSALLKKTYHILVQSYEAEQKVTVGKPAYDYNNPLHRHAFLFWSLLTLMRDAKVTREENVTIITLSRNVFFRLKSLSLSDLSITSEDNPGISNLEKYASDYPLHTLSPITPQEITPETFERCLKEVQALSDKSFFALCDVCKTLLFEEVPDSIPYEAFFSIWQQHWPRDISFESGKQVMIRLAKNYFSFVDTFSEPLMPNHRYLLDRRGVSRFSKKENVPAFIHHLGNFASALCTSFIPHDTQDHFGSCAVNAFLMGLYGPEAYTTRGRNLSRDIQEFRERIVQYATEHFDELKEKITEHDLQELIASYGQSYGYRSWTPPEVWTIAARLYGRTIKRYTCETSEGYFRTDERGEVVPFDDEHEIFRPTGQESGEPIHLLFWGPHYCFLEKRQP